MYWDSWDGWDYPAFFPPFAFKGGKGGKGTVGGKGGKGTFKGWPSPLALGWFPFGKDGKGKGKGKIPISPVSSKFQVKKQKAPDKGPQKLHKRLEKEQVVDIKEAIEANGGSISLGALVTIFEGLKKVQLSEHFNIKESPGLKDCVVTVNTSKPNKKAKDPNAPKKPRKDPNAPPPPDLDEDIVNEITEYLKSNGGSASLGKITTDFPNVKKVQLVPHFEQITGEKGALFYLPGYEPFEPKSKISVTKDRDVDIPELDDVILNRIREYLESNGGSASLGRVTTDFAKVKKTQLEPHFELVAGVKDVLVCIPGCEPIEQNPYLVAGEQAVKRKKNPRSLGQMAKKTGQLAKKRQANESPTEEQPAKKRKTKDPNAPPPPSLEEGQVNKIIEFIESEGGQVSLGRLTTVFPGTKKAQLAERFIIADTGPKTDPTVSCA